MEQGQRFAPAVDGILITGAASPVEQATALRRFLPSLDPDDREETNLFFELFLEADRETAKAVAASLDKKGKRTLLRAVLMLLSRLPGPSELAKR